MDAATHMADPTAQPKPGDVGLCLDCAAILIYLPTLGVRKITDAEHSALPDDVRMEIYRARVAIRQLPVRPSASKGNP